jgi:YVTN family beta-propeller protein
MAEVQRPRSRTLQLFLCHSSQDKDAVRKFHKQLQRDGFTPWLDEENILPGQDWDREIRQAVRAADLVIVCLSPRSISRQGYVHKEIKLALDMADEKPEGAIFVVPVKLEECEVPDRLRRWQWVNLFDNNGYERLVRTFQERADLVGATILTTVPTQLFYAPPAAAILITPDSKEIYTVEEEAGKLIVIENLPDAGRGLKTKATIDLNRSGTAAHPQRLALNPDANTLYITDPLSDEIIVIDRGHNNTIENRIAVGRLPRSIAFTTTGDKAYVSNEGPIPQGSISVIDAHHHRISKTIRGVNSPEGLAISPNDHRLYIASQSGYGQDPVFVIDTRTDTLLDEETIVGMAVGVSVAVCTKHHKLYVARGDFRHRDATTGNTGSPLSIIDLHSRTEVRTHTLQSSVTQTVLTPDDNHVLVGNGDSITIINTATDAIVRTLKFGSGIRGIAVSRENAVYVLLSDAQIKLFGLSGLVSEHA